jgi:hypothetical protein
MYNLALLLLFLHLCICTYERRERNLVAYRTNKSTRKEKPTQLARSGFFTSYTFSLTLFQKSFNNLHLLQSSQNGKSSERLSVTVV